MGPADVDIPYIDISCRHDLSKVWVHKRMGESTIEYLVHDCAQSNGLYGLESRAIIAALGPWT